MGLYELQLGMHVEGLLSDAGIESIEALREYIAEHGAESLLKIKGIGTKSLLAMMQGLATYEAAPEAGPTQIVKRKRKGKDFDPLFFRCDRFPNLRLFIPTWGKTVHGGYVQFRGGCLNLGELAKKEGLTLSQVDKAVEHLLETKWVYREHLEEDEVIVCGDCNEEFQSASDFRKHEQYKHGEKLNVARAVQGT